MLKKQIVKTTSLFTLIFAFMAIGMTANASVMDNEKGKNGEKEKTTKVVEPVKTLVTKTWYFKGGNPRSPNDYTDNSLEAPSCEGPSQTICSIEATEDNGKPKFTEVIDGKSVGQHVDDAMNSLGTSTPLPPNSVVTAYRSEN